MAWTITRIRSVHGNQAVVHLRCTADAATQNIESGLPNVHAFNIGIISMTTTSSFRISYNSLTSGTGSAGYLAASGFTSGDELFITVYGPA